MVDGQTIFILTSVAIKLLLPRNDTVSALTPLPSTAQESKRSPVKGLLEFFRQCIANTNATINQHTLQHK